MDVSGLVKKAREASKKRNWDYAIQLYQQAVTMNPDELEARRELREAAIKRQQESGGAKGKFLKGIGGFGPMTKIKTLGARKKWEEQAKACEEYLATNPRDGKVIYILGTALLHMGSKAAAMQELEDVVHIDGGHVDALAALGGLYEDMEDFTRAISYFERIIKVKPHDQVASKKIRDLAAKNTIQVGQMEDTSDFRKKIKEKDQAQRIEAGAVVLRTAEEIDQAIELAIAKAGEEPKNPDFRRKVADLYKKKRDYDEAEKHYHATLELNPQDYFAKEALDDMAIARVEKRIGELRKRLAEAGGKDPELTKKMNEARVQLNSRQIDSYNRRVAEHPTDSKLRFELGRFLYRGKKINEAIGAFQKTVEDPKLRSDSQHYLGLCFRQKKTYDLAIKQFELARAEHRAFNDKAKTITYDLAKTYLLKKEHEKARTEFEKIFAVDINFRDVSQIMDQLTSEDSSTDGDTVEDYVEA